MPEDVLDAIRLINRIGGVRGENGLPELLPGINIIHGLKNETLETFRLNFAFLENLLDMGLMIRRINLRQVMVFPDTPMSKQNNTDQYHNQFIKFKKKVQKKIDHPMLKRVVPTGTVLKDVMCEVHNGITFGRQLGSYPLLVGIPAKLPLGRFVDITVSGYGQRSITGIPYPLDINNTDQKLIYHLPGIGKKRARTIIGKRPFRDQKDLCDKVEGIEEMLPYVEFKD